MKVLMISGDKKLLNPETEAGKRLALQRTCVEKLDVAVWPQVHSWGVVLRMAYRNKYDVITSQDPFFRGVLSWKVARFIGAKVNIQVHADLEAQTLFKRLLARFVLNRADSLRVVSEKVKDQVQRRGRAVPIHVLPLYVDLGRFENIERVTHENPTILWIGRFEAEKDPLRAIEVLKEVRAAGVDAVLVMLGAGGLEDALRAGSKDLPVTFPGWKPAEDYLKTADIVLCTSPHESWGASIIESLAAGVPVVAPDVGVAREAGAVVVDRDKLGSATLNVLQRGARGVLQMKLLGQEAWAQKWRDTLI